MVGVGILDRSHTHAPMGPGMGPSGSSAGVDLVSSTWGKIKKGRPGGVGVTPRPLPPAVSSVGPGASWNWRTGQA